MATNALDLITTSEVRNWSVFSSLSSTVQDALITAASVRFQNECDRILISRSYVEVKRPGRSRKLYPRQKPLTAISRVATDLTPVMTVQNTDTTVLRARVGFVADSTDPKAVTFTGLSLTPAGAGTVSLLFATYTTLTALAAQINTYSGWTATVAPNYGSWLTADLAGDLGSQGATVGPLQINAYVRDLDYACDPDMANRGVIELLESRPDGYRYPDRSYGIAVSSFGTGSFTASDPRIGAVWLAYTSGWPIESVPADVKDAVSTVAQWLYQQAATSAFNSENMEDYSYVLGKHVGPLPDSVMGTVERYRRREIF